MKSHQLWMIVNIWVVPIVLLLRIICLFINIKLIQIRSDRIGHFVYDGAEQIARHELNSNEIRLYCFQHEISNYQWKKMLSRKLPVYNFLKYFWYWNQKIVGPKIFNKNSSESHSRDVDLLYEKVNIEIPFTKSENEYCQNWLIKKGWKINDPYYCLIVRDESYLNSQKPDLDWFYHSYRNSDIKTYYKAIKWLNKNNIWVFRMGKIMKQPMQVNSNKVIDYAFDKGKNDLLDIWLFANCTACISSGTGPDGIASIYKKPLIFVNYIPLIQIHSYNYSLTFPKFLVWKKNGKILSIKECLNHGYSSLEEYEKNSIIIKSLTEDEILLCIKEHINYHRKKTTSKNYILKQNKFWNLIRKHKDYKFYHNKIHPNSRISEFYLN